MKRPKRGKNRKMKSVRRRTPVRRTRPRARKPARKPRRPVRRARKVARRPVALGPAAPGRRAVGGSRPERSEGLSTDHATFWAGGDLAAFKVEIAPPEVPGGTLRRLGPPPVGPEAGVVERTLRRTYAAASALALSLARR